MEQNARTSFGAETAWDVESENGRYLAELGPIGYMLVWISKIGLLVALLRGYGMLKRAGRRGSAGAALSFAALTLFGNLTFDHYWQALFFLGCGFILAEICRSDRLPWRQSCPSCRSNGPRSLRPDQDPPTHAHNRFFSQAVQGHIGLIQRNAIGSWVRLSPRPQIILFGSSAGTKEVAAEFGLEHVPSVEVNEFGTPHLRGVLRNGETRARHDI